MASKIRKQSSLVMLKIRRAVPTPSFSKFEDHVPLSPPCLLKSGGHSPSFPLCRFVSGRLCSRPGLPGRILAKFTSIHSNFLRIFAVAHLVFFLVCSFSCFSYFLFFSFILNPIVNEPRGHEFLASARTNWTATHFCCGILPVCILGSVLGRAELQSDTLISLTFGLSFGEFRHWGGRLKITQHRFFSFFIKFLAISKELKKRSSF